MCRRVGSSSPARGSPQPPMLNLTRRLAGSVRHHWTERRKPRRRRPCSHCLGNHHDTAPRRRVGAASSVTGRLSSSATDQGSSTVTGRGEWRAGCSYYGEPAQSSPAAFYCNPRGGEKEHGDREGSPWKTSQRRGWGEKEDSEGDECVPLDLGGINGGYTTIRGRVQWTNQNAGFVLRWIQMSRNPSGLSLPSAQCRSSHGPKGFLFSFIFCCCFLIVVLLSTNFHISFLFLCLTF